MDRGGAGAAVIGPVLLLALAQSAGGYAWHTEMPGETVQYGIAGTDDRALRIDCQPAGGLVILGPSGEETDENRPTQVTFRHGDQSLRVLGVTVAMGDGINFTAPVQANELPITTLLAGAPLTIENGDSSWTVPGEGAAAVLAPLVEACRTAPSRR
jgi:hypothetical protein